jgi:AP-3 complex subunit beta
MAQKNQYMFQQHQKSFYVHSTDSIQIKLLKLEILTCLANESNISIILREFQVGILMFMMSLILFLSKFT